MSSWMVAFEALPKVAFSVAVALALGTVMARWLLVRQEAGRRNPASQALLTAVARVAGIVAVVALAARLVGHAVAVFGAAEALVIENLRVVGFASRWGAAWRLQALAAVMLAVTAIGVRRGSAWQWRAFTIGALGCCAAVPLVGHAAGSPVRYALHAAHVAASGAWLGTLAVITLWHVRSSRSAAAGVATPDIGALVRRFSPVALVAAAVVLSSGTIAAILYVGGLGPLVSTTYGRVLLVKLSCVTAVLGCGALNWRRSRRGAAPSRGLMALECALALLTLLVTGVLTETEHP